MKTLIIVILLVVLAGGAFLSRPSEQSFRDYISAEMNRTSDGLVEEVLTRLSTDRYLDRATYHDRYLWTVIRCNDQTEYVGLFSRWFRWADGELKVSGATQ